MAWLTERNWRTLAACRSFDPDLFFPVSSAGQSLEQVAEARAVCASCLVRRQCLLHQYLGDSGGRDGLHQPVLHLDAVVVHLPPSRRRAVAVVAAAPRGGTTTRWARPAPRTARDGSRPPADRPADRSRRCRKAPDPPASG